MPGRRIRSQSKSAVAGAYRGDWLLNNDASAVVKADMELNEVNGMPVGGRAGFVE